MQTWPAISFDTDTYRLSHNWNGEDQYNTDLRIADITISVTTRSDDSWIVLFIADEDQTAWLASSSGIFTVMLALKILRPIRQKVN